ncbi:MAG: type II toxin-antitoxin system RelE/ParE family toxin [Methylomonas sp.]|jgi:mRNA interferase RelE/StbE|uniref:type II toxin-antitoxin system RelE family toxin n=1 Tax=Methylomonas sp. TaxID=418 RepID=UPI0025F58778|nr:type II toxin-antitoxin system RelE/ParE family toxin [Methylomonas sp.]MCK9609133.1 type II toxin-antitoxin system RelE/ParE family toxin [Methylomonas sp.]
MRQIDFTKSAEKSLRKLAESDQRIAKQIKIKLLALLQEPQPQESLKMVGNPVYLRVRVGKYRIIYRFDDAMLYIVLIAKREIVYEEFARLMTR